MLSAQHTFRKPLSFRDNYVYKGRVGAELLLYLYISQLVKYEFCL
jgi:hypothetical protein